ncbi:MAG: hypothetical protein V7695_20610 [Sulfitobacter sp.]
MSQSPSKNAKKKRSDPRELSRFVEELSWFLKSFDDLDYNALSNFSHEMNAMISSSQKLRENASIDGKTAVLVGVLPDFLMDNTLFPNIEGIVEFSAAALGLSIGRWQKKSRYEIIGQIVCHTNDASLERVNRLSDLIEEMLDNKTSVRKSIVRNREIGHSWSEVISSLYDDF